MRWNDRIGRRIKLSDLHILLAVAQSGSMAKAASELAVSHPVVSRSISELEHTLGVRLLDRNPHGVELTEYGHALLNRSHAAFDELRQGVKDIELLSDPTAGEVRIGSTAPLGASFVAAIIDRLSLAYPRMVFHFVSEDANSLIRYLDERKLDLLILRKIGPFAEDRQSFEVLYDNPYFVAAGSKNPWVRRRRIELAELIGELWVLPPPGSRFGSLAREIFDAQGTAVSPRFCARDCSRNDHQSAQNGSLSGDPPRSPCSISLPSIPSSGNCRWNCRSSAGRSESSP